MKDHKYKLKYDIDVEVGEFTKEQLEESGVGGTDALVLISCLYPDDGSYSQAVVASFDGRAPSFADGRPATLTPHELVKVWLMFIGHLIEAVGLDKARQGFLIAVRDTYFSSFMPDVLERRERNRRADEA